MAVNVYRSSDASAPTMNGSIGSLVPVLDACLVNGYGAKAAAGWTKPFAVGNKVVYKMPGGNQRYVQINDTLATTSCAANGFDTMTAVDTGTERFPTKFSLNQVTGVSDFMFVHKGDAAAATLREWMVIATDKCFYFIVRVDATVTSKPTHSIFFFGDYTSHTLNDTNNTMIYSNLTMASNSYSNYSFTTAYSTTISNGICFIRHPSGLKTPIYGGFTTNYVLASHSRSSFNQEDNAIVLSPIYCYYSTNRILQLGYLPGVYCMPITSNSLIGSSQYTFTSGELTGKTFELKDVYSSVPLFFEISNTW